MNTHLIERAALGLAGTAVRRRSWRDAQAVGAFLGHVAARLARSRWALTIDNIGQAFPERAEEERRAWALAAWENLGRIGSECLWAEDRPAQEILQRVCFEGTEHVDAALRDGGCILHLGHFANWEMAGLAFSALGYPLSVVARRIKNPSLDHRVNALRSRFEARLISSKHPFFGCLRALRQGRCVGILMDQNLPKGGAFVPFFGRLAATTTLTALLAHKTGRPILPLRLWREGPTIRGRFEDPFSTGPTPEDTTAALTALIESWVRARPQEWFWFHNRWKRRKDSNSFCSESRG